jgi:transposase
MITNARVKQDLKVSEQFDWITALRAKEIQALFKLEELKISDFDSQDLLEISSTLYPDERLVACKNQQLAKEREQTREALLLATEVELEQIVSAVKKGKLSKTETIALKVGKVISKFKVQKHFILDIKDKSFIYQRNQEAINKEKTTDGIYVIRISLPATELSTENSVLTYKSLAQVERAFRSLKTVDLKIRPIFHRTENRVRAHVFLCMLAYYVEWHMRQSLSSILFDDNAKELAKIERKSVVAKARRSESAVKKASCKINELGFTAHSFQTLISDLGSIVKNYIQPNISDAPSFVKITQPTPYQEKVFELLSIKL